MARTSRKTSSKKKSGRKYSSVREKAKQAAAERERGGGGLDTLKNLPQDIEFFKPKMGKGRKGLNRLSIIPYLVSIENHPRQDVGEIWFELTYWRHTVGSGDDRKSFVCPSKTAIAEDNRCPICEYRNALIKSGSDPELAEELKPKQRQLFNILDLDEEDKGIQLYDVSPFLFGEMLEAEYDVQEEDFGGKHFGDPEDGLSIVARFTKETFGSNSFAKIARIDFEEREDLDDSLIEEEAVDLDAVLRILDYETLNNEFFELDTGSSSDDEEGEVEEDEEGEVEEEKPKRSKRPPRRKKKEEEPEEEEEPDEEPDEEEEDEQDNEPEDDGDNECPAGLNFGYDCDTDDACDECDIWDECRDRLDEIEEEERKEKKGKKRGKR